MLAATLSAQYMPQMGGRQSRQQRTAPNKKNDTPSELLFKFEGIVKESSKKEFVVEVEGEQSLTFRRAKDIKFFNDKEVAKDKSLPVGTKVAVEAKREMNGDLTAMIVRLTPPPK
jgi:hypothetical protein